MLVLVTGGKNHTKGQDNIVLKIKMRRIVQMGIEKYDFHCPQHTHRQKGKL